MNRDEMIEKIARDLRNRKAQEWRKSNKEKVKEINRRYWLKRAEKELENKECEINGQKDCV